MFGTEDLVTKMERILIVDDEEDLLDLLSYNLEVTGYEVEKALTGRAALVKAGENPPDLIVLDVMLPDLLGFEVLRTLRSREETRGIPVILLTARGEESDVLVGFEMGADDYVSKPFSPRELIARIRAVIKRVAGKESARPHIRYGALEIDLDAHRVFLENHEVVLAPQEYKLLAFLATHPSRVYSRQMLIDQAWEENTFVEPRTVDVHIRRLRTRLEGYPSWIETVRGSGYRFNPSPSA